MQFIYLDYQASTPVDPEVIHTMLPYFSKTYANPASAHFLGLEASQAVDKARASIANYIGAKSNQVVFTSGSTEANNLAIKGIANLNPQGHIITVITEHKSILEACHSLDNNGIEVTYLNVNRDGFIDLTELEHSIKPNTSLISVMYGNNEIGTIQNIEQIGKIAKRHGILFHCDATQGIAYAEIDVKKLGVDLLNFSSHKIYGPKGVGAMYINENLINDFIINKQIHGGGQEQGIRGGTLNVPGIVGLAKSIELLSTRRNMDQKHVSKLQKILWEGINQNTNCMLNGPLQSRLPNNLNICFLGINGQKFLESISNLAVSSGSACNSASQEPSHVLHAIGLTKEQIKSSFRISLGRYTTEDEIIHTIECINKAFERSLVRAKILH